MKISVVGAYGVGLTMMSPRFPGPGETLSGGRFFQAHGGKGSNQAIAAARLGAEVSLLTAVGADEYGSAATRLWEEEGVVATTVNVADAMTMVGVIVVDDEGENRIIIAPGALDRLSEEDSEEFRTEFASSDITLVSLEIPVPAAQSALRVAKEEANTTILNPAPASQLPAEVWEFVDVVTPNLGEAKTLMATGARPDRSADETAVDLSEATGAVVVMTMGSQGALVCEDGAVTTVPAVQVDEVVDTTGAGDSFNAALAVGMAEGMTVVDSARLATFAGAHTVSIAGVIPALPSRSALDSIGYAP